MKNTKCTEFEGIESKTKYIGYILHCGIIYYENSLRKRCFNTGMEVKGKKNVF